MTRINTIDVDLLPMPWLVAEYRELPRILNRVAKGQPFPVIPAVYCMGAGHVSFFGNKLNWLYVRHEQLRVELFERGGQPTMDCNEAYKQCMALYPKFCKSHWRPTAEDHLTNLHRLEDRWNQAKRMNNDELPRWLRHVVKRHNL